MNTFRMGILYSQHKVICYDLVVTGEYFVTTSKRKSNIGIPWCIVQFKLLLNHGTVKDTGIGKVKQIISHYNYFYSLVLMLHIHLTPLGCRKLLVVLWCSAANLYLEALRTPSENLATWKFWNNCFGELKFACLWIGPIPFQSSALYYLCLKDMKIVSLFLKNHFMFQYFPSDTQETIIFSRHTDSL